MKKLLIIIFCITAIAAQAQTIQFQKKLVSGVNIKTINDSSLLGPGNLVISGGGSTIIPAGPISSIPTIGFNPGSNITTAQFISNSFYQSQDPIANINGGGVYEFTTVGNVNRTVNWSATRQAATATIATIVVNGVSRTFTQPAQGGTASGSVVVSVPNNTTTTVAIVVTTTDGKTSTASTTFSFSNKIYAGFVTSNTPTDADIFAATGSVFVGGTFSGARNQSGSLSTPSGSKHFIFAAPASFGTPNIVINGLGVSFTLITRNFTNASGFTSSYIIAVSPNPTAGQIDSYIVN